MASTVSNIFATLNHLTSAARISAELLEDSTFATANLAREELKLPKRTRTGAISNKKTK